MYKEDICVICIGGLLITVILVIGMLGLENHVKRDQKVIIKIYEEWKETTGYDYTFETWQYLEYNGNLPTTINAK